MKWLVTSDCTHTSLPEVSSPSTDTDIAFAIKKRHGLRGPLQRAWVIRRTAQPRNSLQIHRPVRESINDVVRDSSLEPIASNLSRTSLLPNDVNTTVSFVVLSVTSAILLAPTFQHTHTHTHMHTYICVHPPSH